jgi:hypothetical protein
MGIRQDAARPLDIDSLPDRRAGLANPRHE